MPWLTLLRFWKPLCAVAVAVAVALYIAHYIHGLERTAYDNGVAAERARVIKLIRTENASNRRYEQSLQASLDDYAHNVAEHQAQLDNEAGRTRTQIIKVVASDPSQNCATNPNVTKLRNSIRAELR